MQLFSLFFFWLKPSIFQDFFLTEIKKNSKFLQLFAKKKFKFIYYDESMIINFHLLLKLLFTKYNFIDSKISYLKSIMKTNHFEDKIIVLKILI